MIDESDEVARRIELELTRPLSHFEWPRRKGDEEKILCEPSSDEEIARRAKAAEKLER